MKAKNGRKANMTLPEICDVTLVIAVAVYLLFVRWLVKGQS